MVDGTVAAVSRNGAHTFSKPERELIELVPGWGVAGDVHAGVTVRHRSRVAADPAQPNLRQVHLIQGELFSEVAAKGYDVPRGGLGENVTTSGIDLLGLPCGTILRFGPPPGGSRSRVQDERARAEAGSSALDIVAAGRRAVLDEVAGGVVDVLEAVVRAELGRGDGDGRAALVVTGLRNPCAQINGFRPGLLKEVLGRDDEGRPVRRAGVMGVVVRGGMVAPGAVVSVEVPAGAHRPLDRV